MSGSSGHSTELLWLVGSIFCIYDCHLKKKWTETFLSHIFFPQIFSFYGFVIRNILNYQCNRLECSLPLVKRKSAKACVFPNFAPAGILGPNGGTSFERLTATLGTERNRDSHKPKYSAMLVNILVMLLCVDFFYCNPLIYPKISKPQESQSIGRRMSKIFHRLCTILAFYLRLEACWVVLPCHSHDLKVNSPNWWSYISLLAVCENVKSY